MLPRHWRASSQPSSVRICLTSGSIRLGLRNAYGSTTIGCRRTHAQAAAQESSAFDQPWHRTVNIAQAWHPRNQDTQPSTAQPVASLVGPSTIQLGQHSEPSAQQKQRAQQQPRLQLKPARFVDDLGKLLAAASVVPALLLAVQPLVTGGNLSAASAASAWQGSLRDLFSFTVLLSVFITCEPGAAAASAVSATGAALQLLHGPVLPPLVACCTATALVATACMVLLTATRNIKGGHANSGCSRKGDANQKAAALQPLQHGLGVLGGGLLAQFLASLAVHGTTHAGAAGLEWLLPVAGGAVAVFLTGMLIGASHDKQLLRLWADWPAWSATLLLILQPLHQLVESSCHPVHLLHSVSPWQQTLLIFASGLMVPRALLQRELMWFTGTFCSGSLAAGQLTVWATQHWIQPWASTTSVTPTASSGITTAATSVVLLVVCVLLQFGWQYIQAPAADDSYDHGHDSNVSLRT